jgi:tetratricopeptide (TPR) repeat protein
MLHAQAKKRAGTMADRLIAQAGEKYEAALKINPDLYHILNSWGIMLSDHTATKWGAEADDLFAQACRKYAAAIEIKPDFYDAFFNWGNAFSSQAETKLGEEADGLFARASEKYEAALNIKPDMCEALNNWAACLIKQAKGRGLDRCGDLLQLAWQRCIHVESYSPGEAAYNLACISSLRNDEASCRQWLEVSRSHGTLPTWEHLLVDADLDNVRSAGWFRGFMSRS